jgi:hypothetical protein
MYVLFWPRRTLDRNIQYMSLIDTFATFRYKNQSKNKSYHNGYSKINIIFIFLTIHKEAQIQISQTTGGV